MTNEIRKHMAKLTELNEKHECTVITIGNHKGGCQKTTTCFNLANYLFEENNRVLLVDTDPQGSLGKCFNVNGNEPSYRENTLSNVYTELKNMHGNAINVPIHVRGDIKQPDGASISLIPGSNGLIPTVKFVEETQGGEDKTWKRFVNLIETYKQYFDYIIFDTTPIIENNKSCRHALSVSDCVVIPVDAIEAIEEIDWTVEMITTYGKKNPNVLFAFTKYQVDDKDLVEMFESQCSVKHLPMCLDPVSVKGNGKIKGYDERRNTSYRFMLKVFPYNICVTGIPEQQRLNNNTYMNVDKKYKTIINSLCLEIKRKAKSNAVENLCDENLWSVKRDLLNKYVGIVRHYKMKNTNIKVNKVVFEDIEESTVSI
ncbi:MAG: ParA family protein [Clostridia bacterium]|jgi:cellulose biosynthesis protein BcsQ|nr:ParA family protein [Clostridia bacterium]